MLGDTTCLTGYDVRVADMVEQRRLTVVYMTHDRHDRSTGHEIALVVFLLADSLLNLSTDILGLEAKLLSDHVDGLCIEALVDGCHDADAHQRGDDLRHGDIHHRGKLRHRHKLGELQHLALLLLSTCLSIELLLDSLTLLLTVLGAFLVLTLTRQTGQRLLYLACYILFVDLLRLVATVTVLLFLTVTVLVAALLVGSGVDVYLIIIDTLALALVVAIAIITVVSTVLLALALPLPFGARLLLRAGA